MNIRSICIMIQLYLILCILLSCISQVMASSKPYVKIDIREKKIGYIGAFHLPTNYPPELVFNERVFGREIYTKKRDDSLGSPTVFVPNDYKNIIESTLFVSLKVADVELEKYLTLSSAREDGVAYILLITPLEFKVVNESKAVIKLYFSLLNSASLKIIWEGKKSKDVHGNMLPSTLKDNLIVTLGVHRYDFQPQRALLAEGTYKCIQEFINEINGLEKKK